MSKHSVNENHPHTMENQKSSNFIYIIIANKCASSIDTHRTCLEWVDCNKSFCMFVFIIDTLRSTYITPGVCLCLCVCICC